LAFPRISSKIRKARSGRFSKAPMQLLTETFLLTFSGLFSIVNPFGAALIFSQVTLDRTHAERRHLARRIAVYAAIIMLAALWTGTYVLGFFGITVSALRIAGGFVVAASAWNLLFQNERHEASKQQQASGAEGAESIAFFPLTMPFTAGPGTIAVAIAIGSNFPTRRAPTCRSSSAPRRRRSPSR
jgi:multiple antibiotic resistance protein